VPPNPLYQLRVNAIELLRQPGTAREIAAEFSAVELEVEDDRVSGQIGVELVATSNADGIVLAGVITTPWKSICRRCLTSVVGVAETDVTELYQFDVTDRDAYRIEGDQIDIAPAIREYVLIDLPNDPLCRADCGGICPVCGIDRNVDVCECDTTVSDDRWAALDSLDLED
jgi:uncharacterized protein